MERFLIIKNIYKKIHIHFLYYLVALLAIITGLFKDFIIFSLLIIIHELGHIFIALYYRWHVEKIIILPFGGMTIFKEHLNKPIFEELMIVIMGPAMQHLFYLLAMNLKPNFLLMNYHYTILFFNMLPIIPLDGSKFLNLISNLILPFKYSHLITIYFSFLVLIGIILFKINNLVVLLILIFLTIKVISEYKNHKYIFNKFLFERYLYRFNFKKSKVIKGIKLALMHRDHSHFFKVGNSFIKERKILEQKFDNSNDLW